MPVLQIPSVRRQRLGVALRRLRVGTGLSAEVVGRRLRWSASKVSRIETARIGVSISDVRRLLRLYEADDQMTRDLLALAAEAGRPRWWDAYPELRQTERDVLISLEDEAASVLTFQADVVPGLLQTEDYARSLVNGWSRVKPVPPEMSSRQLAVRMARQRILQPPRSLPICVVLDESVLLRRIGQVATMAGQLKRLVEIAELPNVTLRILPLDGDHGAGLGSFILLEFDSQHGVDLPAVVYYENITSTISQDEEDAHDYRLAHQWLTNHSMEPEDSIERVTAIAHDRWR